MVLWKAYVSSAGAQLVTISICCGQELLGLWSLVNLPRRFGQYYVSLLGISMAHHIEA